MFATHNYTLCRRSRLPVLTLLAAVGFAAGAGLSCAAEGGPSRPATPLVRAQTVFVAALKQYEAELTNNLAAGEFARAAFERAEFSTNDTERAALAVQGIAACRKLIVRDPKSAPGHYYLGLNLGQMARTKLLGALKIVDEMEREFKTARVLDPQLDHAGPDRCLGLLYYEAPAIGSVGSRSKARKHLERAAELAPDFPPNRLSLAEAYFKWRDKNPLKRELAELEKLWPAAKARLPDADWPAWSRRRQRLEADAAALLSR